MIFDKMILLWSITLILNFNGIVLCQEKDEHHLATECTNKSIKTFNLQNFRSQAINKICCFSDYVCGDKCAKKCLCGGTFISYPDNLYCCITKNETCFTQGMLK